MLGRSAGEPAQLGQLVGEAPPDLDEGGRHPFERHFVGQLVGPLTAGDVPQVQLDVRRRFAQGDRGADHIVHAVVPASAQVDELGRRPRLRGHGGAHAPDDGEHGEWLGVGGEQQLVGDHQREGPR